MTVNYKKEAEYLLNRYNWNDKELELIRDHFEDICEKFFAMPEEIHDMLCDTFTAWCCGEVKKAKLNYWIKKTNTTVEELNIWLTW